MGTTSSNTENYLTMQQQAEQIMREADERNHIETLYWISLFYKCAVLLVVLILTCSFGNLWLLLLLVLLFTPLINKSETK